MPIATLENYKARFRDITNSALYPFGHGLTYGKIEYSDFTISAPSMGMNGEITVTARITNRGRHAAEEVVQLYTHDRVASITRPVRELKAFRKIKLAPGQSEVVSFTLKPAQSAVLRRQRSSGGRAGHVRRLDRAVGRSGGRSRARSS